MTRTLFDHRLTARTTLGVGIALPVVYAFTDAPKDYDDFCALYARWLTGPVYPDAFASAEQRRAEHALNWRVFGAAEPTLAALDRLGWRPNQHQGPLGLWDVKRLDVTGIPDGLAQERLDDFLHGRISPAELRTRYGTKRMRAEELAERTLSEVWCRNIVTDNGATSLLKNLWNNAGSAVAIMNHLVIAFGNQAYAVQTGAAINNASGAQTSIACSGGVQAAAFGNSVSITWSYGTTNAETWTTGSSAPGNQGATSITVVSQTTVSGHTHSAGDFVVNIPLTSDNPASVSNSADSGALPGGDFTFSGTGAGNRQVQIQFTFSTSTAAGAYTESYTSNAGTIASNSTANHLIFPPQTINSTTSLQLTITEKV